MLEDYIMFFFLNDTPVTNNSNTTNLQYIKISGLFNRTNIVLSFVNEVNIYIGENGLGKTTVLNCVYYILKKKFSNLAEITFDEITVKFKNIEKEYIVTSADIRDYNNSKNRRNRFYDDKAIESIIEDSLESWSKEVMDQEAFEIIIRKIARRVETPVPLIRQYAMYYIRNGKFEYQSTEKGNHKKVEELSEAIDENICQKVIYLTTYRRIENDFSNLLSTNDRYPSSDRLHSETELLIQFGMSDVDKAIKVILKKISETSRESFNKMTGVLLKEYASQSSKKDAQKQNLIDKDMLKIIFDRLGNEIEETEKNNIFSLVDNNKIYDDKYSYLLDLIIKLIESYEKQKVYDDKIKKFADACNKYLNGKQFVFDQSELSLYVEETEKKGNIIELSNLSSGEKQIVSLFSKLYLENEKECILIIDEPELSISMKWQKMLLPDIMRSENCKLLLTVTHSPFIFENEFDMDAKEMRNCISE